MFKKSTSYKEDAECVQSFYLKSRALMENFNYDERDIRNQTLNNLEKMGCWGIMNLNILDSFVKGNITTRKIIVQLWGIKKANNPQEIVNLFDKTTKLSFTLLNQFVIENCIKTLNRELGHHNKKKVSMIMQKNC